MALSKGAKIGLAAAAGIGGFLLLSGSASADPGTGNIEVPPEGPPEGPTEPPVEPPPPPPPPGKKNYVGSGWNWPHRDRFPNLQSFFVFLNTKGYAANATQSIVSVPNRSAVRKFQRDFNAVRAEMAKSQPVALGNIATDGLIGVGTINAMRQAEVWENQRSMAWPALVTMARGG